MYNLFSYLRSSSCPDRKREQLRRVLVPIKLQLRESCRMTLNRLAHRALNAVQLHCALHLECAWVRRVARNTDEYHPLPIARDAVVDDLRTRQRCMPVKDFCWRGCLVRNGPVVYGRVGDDADKRVGHPFPEYDVLVVHMRFDLLLRLDVEHLERPTRCVVSKDMSV